MGKIYLGLKDKNNDKIYLNDVIYIDGDKHKIKICKKCHNVALFLCGFCLSCSGDMHISELELYKNDIVKEEK